MIIFNEKAILEAINKKVSNPFIIDNFINLDKFINGVEDLVVFVKYKNKSVIEPILITDSEYLNEIKIIRDKKIDDLL